VSSSGVDIKDLPKAGQDGSEKKFERSRLRIHLDDKVGVGETAASVVGPLVFAEWKKR
jgi:hypothetical protein